MARAIGYSTDHLVTSQHFDDKLESLETRIEGKLAAVESRIDGKLAAVESRIDGKLLALDASLSGRMATLEERMNGKFRYFAFTQAILIGGVFLPLLKNWIA